MIALLRNHRKLRFGCVSQATARKFNTKFGTTAIYRSNIASKYLRDGLVPQHPVAATATLYNYNAAREFSLGQRLYENPSSKVEVTVQTMKEKQKEKVEEIMKEVSNNAAAALEAAAQPVSATQQQIATKPTELKPVPVKKSLQQRIWEEVLHYYHGFRLLFVDINVCRRLLWRILNGKTLTRRENRLLVRTTSDMFRLIPFSVFIIVPFMELLLPVFIKFFPGMLPSTFQTAKEREDKLKQSLQVKLEMAKFLQKTLDEMSVVHKDHRSEEAKQFADFFRKIKNPAEFVSNEDIIKFVKRFEDEVTLDSLSREQLSALCRVLELNTMGTTNFLRFQLRLKLRSLAADDRVIAREGVTSLDLMELQQACKARGMRAYGLTSDRLRSQLQEWIDLSLTEKVPPTLLLLSRALRISDDTTTTDKLKEIIRVLPDSVGAQTKAAIGEREGKIDNKTKIEVIKEEQRKIKEELEEEREEQKAKAEELLDKAPVIASDAAAAATAFMEAHPGKPKPATQEAPYADAVPGDKKSISSKDVELLSDALRTLSSDNKKMAIEKETIKDLKEELEDYKEDVEELHEVRNVVQEPVQESRAAKLLFKKVNNMIGQLDQVLEDLEKKHQQLAQATELTPAEEALKRKEQEIVRIDELVSTIMKLKQTSDESRLQHIANVLSKIDTDKDGVITIDEVLKVVEAMGRENVNLNEHQLEDLITLLDKEQLIEAEEKIEKAIAKSIKEAQLIEAKKLERQQLELAIAEEMGDKAPELVDKAKVLVGQDGTKSAAGSDATLLDAAEERPQKARPHGSDIAAKLPTPPPSSTGAGQQNTKDKMV